MILYILVSIFDEACQLNINVLEKNFCLLFLIKMVGGGNQLWLLYLSITMVTPIC